MSSRFARCALPIALLIFAHCGSSTEPSSALTGLWREGSPSGSRIDLSLSSSFGGIIGTGRQYVVGSLFDSLTVSGHWNADHTFHLAMTFANTTPATYDGAFVGSNQLDGTMTRNGDTAPHVAFFRQTQ